MRELGVFEELRANQRGWHQRERRQVDKMDAAREPGKSENKQLCIVEVTNALDLAFFSEDLTS